MDYFADLIYKPEDNNRPFGLFQLSSNDYAQAVWVFGEVGSVLLNMLKCGYNAM